MPKAYITGIAGLIGSNLVLPLLKEGYEVIGCDNLVGGYKDNIPIKYCRWDNVDMLDTEAMSVLMKDVDIVFHTASLPYEGLSVFSPKLITESIYTGTVSVASAAIANNVKRFINFSSMARYGEGNPPFRETHSLNPVDPYGLAKAQAEAMLNLLHDIHGITVYHVVPHNVVGKGQVYTDPYRNVAAIFVNRLLLGKKVIIYGDGSQKRSFSPIGACINAIIRLINTNRFKSGEVFNIGPHGNEISIKDLAYKLAHYCNVYPHFDYLPDRPREVKNAYCSSDKAIKELNYNPNMTSNEELYKEIVNWVRDRGPAEFNYKLPIEIYKDNTPRTWTEKLL